MRQKTAEKMLRILLISIACLSASVMMATGQMKNTTTAKMDNVTKPAQRENTMTTAAAATQPENRTKSADNSSFLPSAPTSSVVQSVSSSAVPTVIPISSKSSESATASNETHSSAFLVSSSQSPISSSPLSPLSSSSSAANLSSDISVSSVVSVSVSTLTTINPALVSESSSPTRSTQPQLQRPTNDPKYIPMVAAIVSGFSLLVTAFLLFLTMALIYRHLGKKDPMMTPLKKPKKGGDGALYSINEPQSAQYLVSSMSITSFGSSPSDVRLESHLAASPSPLVYYNRSLEADERNNGSHNAVSYEHEEGYKPIQIVAADATGRPKSYSKV